MTTLSEIKYSQLENRFDSEYYHPLKLNYLRELGKLAQAEEISNNFISIRDIFDPNSFQEKEKLAKVVRLEDIANFSLSKFQVCKAWKVGSQKKKIKTGDILISRLRSYLKEITFVTNFNEGINLCSTEFIVLRPKQYGKILPTFLFAFLLTKQAQTILQWSQEGSNHPRFPERVLLSIKIPIPPKPFQQKIEKLVKEAFSKRKLADQKYNQAKQFLEKGLGLDKLELKEKKNFEANFSNLEQNLRFDSEYYKPKYKQITEFLKNSGFEVRKLKEVVKISDKKIDPTKEPTKKFRYVPIAKINSNGEIGEWDEFSGWQAPSRARMLIKKGDVLVSSLGGSIDKIALVPEELNNSLATTGTFVINSDNFYSEFLFLLFRTELIKLQLEQKTAGAIMTAVPKTTFGDLLIPVLPKLKQEKISELVRESFSLRKESKNLLEESKKKVETAIENGT